MITIVVPTRNRAYTLRKVLPSYFQQEGVCEVLLVNDAGEDDTPSVLQAVAKNYSHVRARCITNDVRRGASHSRGVGIAAAATEYILFCDDDEYLEHGYAMTCLKLLRERKAGAVSGRRIYMLPGETPSQSLSRFGNGVRKKAPFDYNLCVLVNGAIYTGELALPCTYANILVRRDLALQYGFDSYYSSGNGFREETDFQMNLFVNGHDIYCSNFIHTFHLPMTEVATGGQRVGLIQNFRYSVHYNNYFLDKYYDRYRKRAGLRRPRWVAKAAGLLFLIWLNFIRPPVHAIASKITHRLRTGNLKAQ